MGGLFLVGVLSDGCMGLGAGDDGLSGGDVWD